jgi:hypothetical protein
MLRVSASISMSFMSYSAILSEPKTIVEIESHERYQVLTLGFINKIQHVRLISGLQCTDIVVFGTFEDLG